MNAKNLVVITGATRGLGHAMAEEFARLGHTVVGCGRSQREVAQLGQKMGKPHDFAMVNVASDAEVKSWAAETLRGHGAPRLLLNNAAIINKNARLWEVSAEEFSQVIDVNIKGTVSVIRHFLPAMLKKGKGVIVNFSFRLGTLDGRGSRALLRQQVGYRRLDAVALNPGIINTDMLQGCFGGSASNYPSPTQWAKTAVPFLLGLGPADNGKQLTAPSG